MTRDDNLCKLCPRRCGADRKSGGVGFCGAGDSIVAARASLHLWEEPCLSGERGSGTVFFSGCPLKCVFCQNFEISANMNGRKIGAGRLCEIFFELREKGAHNINLVSPTPYIFEVAEAIKLAKKSGFDLPFVYNSSGYELPESLKMLDGLIDIYLPDFKYESASLAKKYSNAEDYPERAFDAICEMVRQCPTPLFEDDMIKRGVIVRHLVLPSQLDNSKAVIKRLYEAFGDKIFISIMSQYTPVGDLSRYPELSRTLSEAEYDEVVDYAIELGVTNGFIQDGEAASESFIPIFDGFGI